MNCALRQFWVVYYNKRIGGKKERNFILNDFQNILEPLHIPLPLPGQCPSTGSRWCPDSGQQCPDSSGIWLRFCDPCLFVAVTHHGHAA